MNTPVLCASNATRSILFAPVRNLLGVTTVTTPPAGCLLWRQMHPQTLKRLMAQAFLGLPLSKLAQDRAACQKDLNRIGMLS